jgi:hypothetical protein
MPARNEVVYREQSFPEPPVAMHGAELVTAP